MKVFRVGLLVFLVQIAAAQQPPSAALQGVVVQEGTNAPLAGVRVDLRPTGAGTTLDSSTTDRDGRFSFPRVTPGSYRLIASKLGYVNAEYGQRLPSGPVEPLVLTPGQRLNNVRLTMFAGGVISGRATDNGQPVGIADVYAMKIVDVSGISAPVAVMSAKTNDLGEFRIFWLPPGQYYVALDIQDQASQGALIVNPEGDDVSYPIRQRAVFRAVLNRAVGAGAAADEKHVMTFYPGTVDLDRAIPVQVRAGSEAPNINISGASLPIRTVRGKVNGVPKDQGLQTPAVELVQTNFSVGQAGRLAVALKDDGTFEIPRVIPGVYNVVAAAGNLLGGGGTLEVAGADVNNLEVNLVPGIEVSGRIVIERQPPITPDPTMAALRVILRPEPPLGITVGSAPIADGTFKIPASTTAPGVPTGDYRVYVAPVHIGRTIPGNPTSPVPTQLQNVYVKSIRLGDRDLLNDTLHIEREVQDKLEIVIGTNPGSIEGRVMTNRQQPAGMVWVALLPANKTRFKVDHRFMSTNPDGRFQFENVPPGDYQVYAWEDIEKLTWQEPRLMRAYESQGTPLHIDEGRKATIELTAIPPQN